MSMVLMFDVVVVVVVAFVSFLEKKEGSVVVLSVATMVFFGLFGLAVCLMWTGTVRQFLKQTSQD